LVLLFDFSVHIRFAGKGVVSIYTYELRINTYYTVSKRLKTKQI
jgi:hypothetical protein